jgi:RNA recognition motif-containing protein
VTGSSKGYAFIEYEKKEAANQAYHCANNLTIDGRRIFVDFECERKLPGWKPRRLGICYFCLL